jgi:phosphomethylpyrimidine synthase
VCAEHDVTLSLGDGLRPGALADSFDAAQVTELVELASLVRRARAAGVQVIVEGPGHVPLDEVAAQVRLQKRLCDGAPFYVLGPLVTDIAAGYDHIAGAIGGALAALAGADFLCYVTPSEHLGLPTVEDVRKGVVASRIAAHAADLARGIPGARERDEEFSRMRAALDWPGMIVRALDPAAAEAGHARGRASEGCSMCGAVCVFRATQNQEKSASP